MSKYSLEFKLEIVNRVLLGKDSVNAIARIYEVDRGFVRSWSDAYKYHGVDGLTVKRYRYDGQFKGKDNLWTARVMLIHFQADGSHLEYTTQEYLQKYIEDNKHKDFVQPEFLEVINDEKV